MSSPFDRATLSGLLPRINLPTMGEPFPGDIIGAEIIAFGGLNEDLEIGGGGLVIDYRPRGAEKVKRIVFALGDAGMCVEYQSDLE